MAKFGPKRPKPSAAKLGIDKLMLDLAVKKKRG
jgi:hypothetical protein